MLTLSHLKRIRLPNILRLSEISRSRFIDFIFFRYQLSFLTSTCAQYHKPLIELMTKAVNLSVKQRVFRKSETNWLTKLYTYLLRTLCTRQIGFATITRFGTKPFLYQQHCVCTKLSQLRQALQLSCKFIKFTIVEQSSQILQSLNNTLILYKRPIHKQSITEYFHNHKSDNNHNFLNFLLPVQIKKKIHKYHFYVGTLVAMGEYSRDPKRFWQPGTDIFVSIMRPLMP